MNSNSPAHISVKKLILCALFAALTAVCSQIAIPLPFTPVPLNLATLSVFLAGGLLGMRHAALSQLVYICLGLVGLPVFAQFTGGPGILLGSTGGYIIGYALAAFLIGVLFDSSILQKIKAGNPSPTALAAVEILFFMAGLLACYIPGTLWFMTLTHMNLMPSLLACVFPFLPGDALKIVLALLVTRRLRPHLNQL